MTELPIWARYESDEEEATRLAAHYLGSGRAHRFLAATALEGLKEKLDEVPRWRLVKRYRLVREAKLIAKDAGLV